jgi:crotonobetainyl-CoA:carnitine CoA-transferase CaiB-like acyl-CoA transferase
MWRIYMLSGPINGFRALDLTDAKGFLCGKIMGDLGVDVIKIEKPGGDLSRNKPPFFHDVLDPEKSLYWFAYNTNKRGITLDIESNDGQRVFKRLVENADFVLESFPPGYMAKLGLDYEHLTEIHPEIIMTSITDFGQTGPYAKYKGSDLVLQALGLMLSQIGDADRAPVRISVPQAYMHASADAAEGTLMAHYYRGLTGQGQYVDVSAMESVIWASNWSLPTWDASKTELKRLGSLTGFSGRVTPQVWKCKDGWVIFTLQAGMIGARDNPKLTDWMNSEGMAPALMRGKDWINWDWMKATCAELDTMIDAITKFFLNHTKSEIQDQATKRRIILYAVSSITDILENIQLKDREFWVDVYHDELADTFTYPGAFAKFSRTSIASPHRAPLIGEHNDEILKNIQKSFDGIRKSNKTVSDADTSRKQTSALKDLIVIGFVTDGVGPLLTKGLAINGATVVHVESEKRPDGTRMRTPFKDNVPGIDRGYRFAQTNTDKYDMSLNLKHPRAKEVTRKLIETADVIVENYRPGVMKKFGLSYEEVSAINPSIIMVSLSSQGQTGPFHTTAAYGPHLAGYAGFTALAGWPDRGPVNVGPYTDMVAPHFGIIAVLAALDYRRRTGEGQYIDLSQCEAGCHFLAPALLDYTMNGKVQTRAGNKSACTAPHGVYRCKGDDRWCAITVFTDLEWESFCRVIGGPAWTENEKFSTLSARRENEEELNQLVENWTAEHEAEEIMNVMQEAGIAAGAVRNAGAVVEDCPQLKHRHFWWKSEHPEIGTMNIFGSSYTLSKTPYKILRPAPRLGEHTGYICSQFLKMTDEEFTDLFVDGVFS